MQFVEIPFSCKNYVNLFYHFSTQVLCDNTSFCSRLIHTSESVVCPWLLYSLETTSSGIQNSLKGWLSLSVNVNETSPIIFAPLIARMIPWLPLVVLDQIYPLVSFWIFLFSYLSFGKGLSNCVRSSIMPLTSIVLACLNFTFSPFNSYWVIQGVV